MFTSVVADEQMDRLRTMCHSLLSRLVEAQPASLASWSHNLPVWRRGATACQSRLVEPHPASLVSWSHSLPVSPRAGIKSRYVSDMQREINNIKY